MVPSFRTIYQNENTVSFSKRKSQKAIIPSLRALCKIDLYQIGSLVKNRRNKQTPNMRVYLFYISRSLFIRLVHINSIAMYTNGSSNWVNNPRATYRIPIHTQNTFIDYTSYLYITGYVQFQMVWQRDTTVSQSAV